MRKETRFALGVVGLSALATSYLVGQQSVQPATTLASSVIASSGEPTVVSDSTTSSTPAPSPAQAATTEPTAEPTPSPTADPSKTTDPTPATSVAAGTFQSKNVGYRYGNIQLEVTLEAGQLLDITLIQATTEGRGYDQAPPMLVDAALQAGSADFANLSGATYTSMAFKEALTDALNQAGL